jgi:hypothetical protein
MKTRKLLITGILALLGLAHFASAQTAIYLSGAPATRKIWNLAILDTLENTYGNSASNLHEYFTGSAYSTANQIVITGGTVGGNAVTIYGSWTGSTGGNQSVANTPPATIAALKVGYIDLTQTSGTGSTATSNTNNFEYPQVNLSDTQQTTIPFNGTTSVTSPTTSYVTLNEAPTTSPAVTGFVFVANKGAPASINNLTTNLAQVLFTNGQVPLALFSGSASDEGPQVYAVGRDIASGARYVLLAETGIGTANSDSLVQYEPAVTSGTITNISSNLATSGTINLIPPITGNGGYPSFSAVETVLSAVSSGTSVGYIVTYVTDTDAVTAEAAGATALNWNGVPYSVSGIQQGQYSFWSYLHVYYNNTSNYIQTNFPLSKTFADALALDLKTDTNDGAILASSLKVTREYDGGLITPNY